MTETTPMMQQYRRIKKNHPSAILFFRLGDFYEMFEQDAKIASSILGLTLTARNGIAMCGIPYHSASSYVGKLLKAGKKVAVCEQVSQPKDSKGIVDRQVMEVLTPGTIVEENYLEKGSHNFLCSIGLIHGSISISYIDLSTGDFYTSLIEGDLVEGVRNYLARIQPKELIVQETLLEENERIAYLLSQRKDLVINRYPDWYYNLDLSIEKLLQHFHLHNVKGLGFIDHDPALFSCGVLLDYLNENAKIALNHVKILKKIQEADYLILDDSTIRNLELLQNSHDQTKHYSVFEVLDHSKTAMGARLLKQWLSFPLVNKKAINERLDATQRIYHDQFMLSELRKLFSRVLDLERLTSRVAMDKAHAKDLKAIEYSVTAALETVHKTQHLALFELTEKDIHSYKQLISLIERSILEEPSTLLSEGRLIKRGYREELDEIRDLKENSQAVLESYLESERKNTGINNLKVRYNKIIGYYLEVSKGNLGLVPEHFRRRQSLVNNERFTTDKLLELESNLNSANEKTVELEKGIFLEVRNILKGAVHPLQKLAEQLAIVDCLQSFAYAATIHGFVKPEITADKNLFIENGRHPVVELNLQPGEFVPNDLSLSGRKEFFALITGPNMAGKSTYLRQTAIIVLMAQVGSFVPADSAKIGVADRIFCRVGASDNLARGESTFLVEMNETANILRQATSSSLIIMDEVGRGTSTNDGLSIAWAVCEYILNHVRAKTLFATHYHELTLLEHPKLKNLSLEVLDENGRIVFLKRIKEAAAAGSYGIHVAEIAGLPEAVIKRAQNILMQLGEKELCEGKAFEDSVQVELFSPTELLLKEIESINPDTLSPLEALEKLYSWKKILK